MEEPSHHHCHYRIKNKVAKNRQENQKKEEAVTPDYPAACSPVMQLQIGGMEGIAHVPSENK